MDRRNFCKLAVLSSAGVGSMLLNANLTLAKGIPSGAFTGRGTDKCYPGPPQGVILTSLTDLFKIGPGPSSSHTIAPLRIADNFRQTMEEMPKDRIGNAQTHFLRVLITDYSHMRRDRYEENCIPWCPVHFHRCFSACLGLHGHGHGQKSHAGRFGDGIALR
ncbi:MAG: serine dehydratase beta chain [Thermodesulfobacteriota bacterium]